ncbi:hypothetical protein [Kitasatospora sp. NBC_01266]|uniref:hypothetical protein n=1 Tax=Kitasatospora sp. NBC_01266 TaxID=2903572 RepID=UPI002E35C8F7|nr:hypothetical protein [Kitasatospora sp. NBC_01266]
MDSTALDVALVFRDPDGPEVADRDMEFLLDEIRQLDVLRLAHAAAPAPPPGTRAADASVFGSVLLGLAGAPALKSLILLAQDWLARRNGGTIDLKVGDDELHLTSVSRADQRLAIEAFVARAAQPSSDE